MSLPKLPEAVARADVLAFCGELDLAPKCVQALEFGVYGLYVTVLAVDTEGNRLSDGREAATHRIFIPFGEEASNEHPPPARE